MHTGAVNLARFTVLAAWLLAFSPPSAVAADPRGIDPSGAEPPGIDKAQKLVDDHKTIIARFMHPTSSLDKMLCTKTRRYDTGEFYLVYAFYFDGDRYHSSLRFRFFEDGSLDSIDVAGAGTWVKPFQAGDLVLHAVMGLIPQPISARVTGLLREGATKTALELWLRSRP